MNKEINIATRIINLIFSFLLFYYFLFLLRIRIWGVFRDGLVFLIPPNSESVIAGWISIGWGIVASCNILMLMTVSSAVGTVFKDSRRWFLKYSIFGWILYSLDIYFINTVSEEKTLFSNVGELIFYLMFFGIVWGILRYFYTRPQTKLMLD